MVRIHPDPPTKALSRYSQEFGGVAQLGERLLCKQEVIGSIPFTSTRFPRDHMQATRLPSGFLRTGMAVRSLTIRKK
jgi:hypothetical protein